MTARTTESLHELASGLDSRPRSEAASILVSSQVEAANAVLGALPAITDGALAMARTLRNGGCLHYLAAGSSGLMAAADALELVGTFSINPNSIAIHMAGGLPSGISLPGGAEDCAAEAEATILDIVATGDTVIAVSASGDTPFTVAGAKAARQRGVVVVAIVNNGDGPLLDVADHAIVLRTPPEVVSGSTRLGAGTSQKIALNTLSTLMAIELGHVHDGMMVNVRVDNAKLLGRATAIVQRLAQVGKAEAGRALQEAEGEVKIAVVMASHGVSADEARDLIGRNDGMLRAALTGGR